MDITSMKLAALLLAQVAIKKFDNHVERIPRLRDIYVVKESMEQPFPDMKFSIHA